MLLACSSLCPVCFTSCKFNIDIRMNEELYGFTKEEVRKFREEYAKCLRELKDDHGNRFLKEEHVRAVLSHSDSILAYNMQFNTPQSLADIEIL